MNRIAKVSLKILKWVGIVILSLVVLFFATRWIGQGVNKITPKGGINKSMYVDINGSKQWISIYGKAMTEFLRGYLQVDKITLLGHSWGSYFGANLALAHPDYYDAFIGTGQFIDWEENEGRLYKAALTWSENDPEGRAI